MVVTNEGYMLQSAFDNEKGYKKIAKYVAKEILNSSESASLNIGGLSTNYFSFTFSLCVHESNGAQNVFVKIPKGYMRGQATNILSNSDDDKIMFEEEVKSLRYLNKNWGSSTNNVEWVKLLGVVNEYNALITERIFGDDALNLFRRLDIRRRFGFVKERLKLENYMCRIGGAVYNYHRENGKVGDYSVKQDLNKINKYCSELSGMTKSKLLTKVTDYLQSINQYEYRTIIAPTLKGIDVRNVLVGASDELYILDPGKMKTTCREADLSRFLLTYRILYWGSIFLLLFKEPDINSEKRFINQNYPSDDEFNADLLNIFLVKEILKHWHTALDSLSYLSWSPRIKNIVQKIYVNPFYEKQLKKQLLPNR